MMTRFQIPPQPTNKTPKHNQKRPDKNPKLNRILGYKALNNLLGIFQYFLQTKYSSYAGFDQVAEDAGFGGGCPA